MINIKNNLHPMTVTTRPTVGDTHRRYLDETNDGSLVITVQHGQQSLNPTMTHINTSVRYNEQDSQTTTHTRQKEDQHMLQYRRGMMVVRHEEQETQRQVRQREQELRTLFNQQQDREVQTTQQRRRFQRGMMVNTPQQ
jgi:hypothetical protein